MWWMDPPLPPETLQRRRDTVRQFIDGTHGDMQMAEDLWRLKMDAAPGTLPAALAAANTAAGSGTAAPAAAAEGPARRAGRKR